MRLGKSKHIGDISNIKRPGQLQKRTENDYRILSVKTFPYTTPSHVKNSLQKVGILLSEATIKRRLHKSKHSVFNTVQTFHTESL